MTPRPLTAGPRFSCLIALSHRTGTRVPGPCPVWPVFPPEVPTSRGRSWGRSSRGLGTGLECYARSEGGCQSCAGGLFLVGFCDRQEKGSDRKECFFFPRV